ncbi:MAG: YebC/PmpR family DNA-binding transcriptional regulator, partial [Clostridia bacterium]|nr:YebC/PmpR family DNA-binding transcriptional regulator [Clostridia bacterium]
DAIAKAKAANVPNENIERIIKKAAGDSSADNYEELIYEGYGPCGIAVVVETLTDNRNRTAGEMRHYFDKCGGNLGQSGSVMFMFDRKGQIVIEVEGKDEDTVMEDALEAGAEDFNFDGDVFEITTEPNDLGTVRDALEEKGYTFETAEVAYIPQTMSSIDDPDAVKQMEKLIDMLEENDDVQEIWHNWEMPEEE